MPNQTQDRLAEAERNIGWFLDRLTRLSDHQGMPPLLRQNPRPLVRDRKFIEIAIDDCTNYLETIAAHAKKEDFSFDNSRLPVGLYRLLLQNRDNADVPFEEAEAKFAAAVDKKMETEAPVFIPDLLKVMANQRKDADKASVLDELEEKWADFMRDVAQFYDGPDRGFAMSVAREFTDEMRKMDAELREKPDIYFPASNLEDRDQSPQGIANDLEKKLKGEMQKANRIYYLREQIKVCDDVKAGAKKELRTLGEKVEGETEIEKFEALAATKNLPPDALARVQSEIEKLKTPGAEQVVSRNWLTEVLKLPWGTVSETNSNIPHAKQVLDETHHGLGKVKERVLESLAVLGRQGASAKGGTLIFDGPAGTGKTSIGESVAKATGRKFQLVSLGGGSDAHAIKGHSRTYIGAARGKIIKAIQDAGTDNCVIMLDEIEKLATNSAQGDPMAALLAVLDPEQNKGFVDEYIDMPYDLSKVLFIANSNSLEPLSFPLLNRMEVIRFEGYARDEKLVIAKNYLLPKQMKDKGMSASEFSVSDDALGRIIDDYTQEMGLRSVDKAIDKIARKAALKMATGETTKVDITAANIEDFLGSDTIEHPKIADEDAIGHVNGMAWTQLGGDLLAVEGSVNPNTNRGIQITATGHLGQDMTESGSKAVTAIRNFLDRHSELKDRIKRPLENADIHIDAPTVIPKDGPSAGVTMVTSLLSSIFDIAVKRTVSMTGEITTREKVMAIGGLDRKIPAAIAAGVTDIIVPRANHKSLEQVKAKLPEDVRKNVRFHEVGSIEDLVSLKDQFGQSIVFASPILSEPEQKLDEDNVAIFPLPATTQAPAQGYERR